MRFWRRCSLSSNGLGQRLSVFFSPPHQIQIITQPSAVTREGTTTGALSCDCANSHNRVTGRVYQLTKLATRLTGVSTQLPRLLASHLSTQVKLDKASLPGSCSSPCDLDRLLVAAHSWQPRGLGRTPRLRSFCGLGSRWPSSQHSHE